MQLLSGTRVSGLQGLLQNLTINHFGNLSTVAGPKGRLYLPGSAVSSRPTDFCPAVQPPKSCLLQVAGGPQFQPEH